MNLKNVVTLTGLFFTTLLFTAFVHPENAPQEPAEEGEETFADFLSHFEKTALPFSIELADFENYQPYQVSKKEKVAPKKMSKKKRVYGNPLSRTKFIPAVARGRFSRMGPPAIHPVAWFYLDNKRVAIVYSSQTWFGLLNKNYNMIVYDLKGNIVFPGEKGHAFSLGYSSTNETMICQIDEEGHIWKNTFTNVWAKDIQKKGLKNNRLVDFKIKETLVFEVNEKGAMVQLKEIPSSDRAEVSSNALKTF